MVRFLLILAITFAIVTLLPLSNPADHQGMTLAPAEMPLIADSGSVTPVWIESVTGGIEPSRIIVGTSRATSESIREAVRRSLRNAGVRFDDDGAGTRIEIDVNEQERIDSVLGSPMTRAVVLTYTVSRDGVRKAIVLETTGAASFSDSIMLTERTRIALERALKVNLEQFFDFLAAELGR